MAIEPLHWDQGPPEATEGSEVELISRAKAGDGEAFADLYRRYRPQVMRLALARLPERRTAEEVVQETFARALHRLDRFDLTRPFGPWLMTIAANLVVDTHRTRDRTVPTERAELIASHADPVDAVLAAEGVSKIKDALSMLSPRQRRILLGSTLLEMSPAELARQENVSEASVTSVVYRARLAVRRSLRRLATVLLVLRAFRSRVRSEIAELTGALTVAGAEGASALVLSIGLIAVVPTAMSFGQPSLTRAVAPSLHVLTADRHGLGRPPVAVVPRGPATTPSSGPVKTRVRVKPPGKGSAAPSTGRVSFSVVGPDGKTLAYQDTDFDCGGTPSVSFPESSPVRRSC